MKRAGLPSLRILLPVMVALVAVLCVGGFRLGAIEADSPMPNAPGLDSAASHDGDDPQARRPGSGTGEPPAGNTDSAPDAAPDSASDAPARAESPGSPDDPAYVPDVVLVEVADTLSADEVNEQLASLDYVTTKRVDAQDLQHGFVELELAEGVDVETALGNLADAEFAASAQPNYIYHVLDDGAPETPAASAFLSAFAPAEFAPAEFAPATAQATSLDDPRASEQWGLAAVRAYEAWDYVRVNRSVTVAVLDSGLDADHEDFVDADGNSLVVGGRSIVKADGNDTDDPSDYDDVMGHGTHVAGIIAAGANNGTGVAGASYNANVMPVRILDQKGNVTSANAAKGIDYIIENAKAYNVKVLNMSFGTTVNATGTGNSNGDALLKQALARAHRNDILVVCAAGNGGAKGAYNCYPCDTDPEAIGVINVQQSGNTYVRASSSNFNKAGQATKELSAPGTSILSTTDDGSYGMKSGTSMATPYVSGVAALVFAADPDKSAAEVKQVLIDTARDIGDEGFDLQTGYGLVDAAAAVKASASYLIGDDIAVVGGGPVQLTAESPAPVTWAWESSNASVASVDAAGKVEPKAAGTVTITATSSDGTVLAHAISVYDPAILGATTVEYGALATLSTSADNPSSAWVWSSSDASVASIGTTSGSLVAMGIGTAQVTVALNRHPEVTATVAVTVTKADLAHATLSGVKDQIYAGKPVTLPNLRVSMPDYTRYSFPFYYTSRQLTDGTGKAADLGDYEVSYANNDAKGTATVTVAAKASSARYKGSQSATFDIGDESIEGATVTGTGSYAYTGSPITVTDLKVTSDTGKELVEGEDYKVVYPADHTNAGTVYISIEGIGDHVGSVTKYFTINAVSIASDDIAVSGIVPKTYTGGAVTQSPTLTFNGKALVEGADYAIYYSNNVNAGTAAMQIRGLGNFATYTGFFSMYPAYRTETFAINPASMADVKVAFDDVTYNGSAQRPAPSSVTLNGVLLNAGTDYTVAYPDDCTNAGEKRVVVSAGSRGNLSGSTGAAYTIGRRPAVIAAKDATKAYDGTELAADAAGYTASGFLSPSDVASVSLSGSVTDVGSAPSVVASYALADGMDGNYDVSTVDGTLQVTAASLAWASISLSQSSYLYDGGPKHPDVTVAMGQRILVAGVDYEVAYSDNVEVGNAWAMVSGKGNYRNSKAAPFSIVAGESAMFRLYNPYSGEHFYTASESERDEVIAAGWTDEGVGWMAPSSGDPVYRLYNPYAGEHHYTLDASERDDLVATGWIDEGVGWLSDPNRLVPLYREYNPNMYSCNHNYTVSLQEHGTLVALGWHDEGIAWYGC